MSEPPGWSGGRSEVEAALLGTLPALLAFFRHRLPAELRDQAEDFAQDTLLAAWRALSGSGSGEVRDPLRYVLGIARHKCQDGVREARRQQAPSSLSGEDSGFGERVANAVAESRLLEDETHRRLAKGLHELPAVERDVLRLRYFEELSNEAASRRLGVLPEEASRLRYRALQRLRSMLRIRNDRRIRRSARLDE